MPGQARPSLCHWDERSLLDRRKGDPHVCVLNGWGIYGLNGWGIYDLNGWGMYDLNGWGIYGSNGWGS